MTPRARDWVLTGAALAPLLVLFGLEPIPQDLRYHALADRRSWLGIPHAGDVLSSLGFAVVAWMGWRRLASSPSPAELRPYLNTFLIGVGLTAAGSAAYHWRPDNLSLALDRLAMSLAFAGLIGLLIGGLWRAELARRIFPAVLLAAPATVLYWLMSELAGRGDLRPYALLQFGPLPLLVGLLWLGKGPLQKGWLGGSLGCYGLAKLCELYDTSLLAWSGLLSGHTLKHLLAATGAWLVMRAASNGRSRTTLQ